ncbi:MAG TPA: hypothetical protein VHG08_10460 [Longimicrobium sp.]|nr:hypothetical protein [Longimicrobium sp.]
MPFHRSCRVLLIAAAALAPACAPAPPTAAPAPPATTREEDERAVWRAVIEADTTGSMRVIADSTEPVGYPYPPSRRWLRMIGVRFPYAAIRDIEKHPRLRLSEQLGEMPRVHWLTRGERRQIFTGERGAYERFRARFPGARELFGMTRVGFDARRRYAAVGRGFWCGIVCGAAGYALLRREPDGRWVVIGEFNDGIS